MPTGGSISGGAKRKARKPASKKRAAPKRKPAARKTKRKPASKSASTKPLGSKTVVDLRKMAKRVHARQTNKDGSTKNKTQLMASIRTAKK